MALQTVVPVLQYHVVTRDGFGSREFSGSSATPVAYPEGIQFVVGIDGARPFVLQSLDDAVLFRAEAVGTPEEESSAKYQLTRTTAVYFVDNGKVMIAFDDSPDSRENLILSFAKKGFALHSQSPLKELVLQKKNSLVDAVLQRSERRTHEHPGENLELALDGTYSSHQTVRDMLGNSAGVNEEYLKGKNFSVGLVLFLDEDYVREQVGKNRVLVRPCGLGGGDYDYISNVDADDLFGDGGRARGVRPRAKNSLVKGQE